MHCFSDSVNIHVLLPSCLLTTNNFMFEFFADLVMPKHISEHRMHSLCRPNISPWGILNGLWLVCGSWFLCCVSHCITLSFASLQLYGGVVSLSCLSSLVYRLHPCGLREQKLHLWRSSCDRCLMELCEVCFLFVLTTEKSAEVAFNRPFIPSHHPSVPHPTSCIRHLKGEAWVTMTFLFLWHKDPVWNPFTSTFYRTRMGTVKKCQPGPEYCDTVVPSRGSEPFPKRGTKDHRGCVTLCLLWGYQIFTC